MGTSLAPICASPFPERFVINPSSIQSGPHESVKVLKFVTNFGIAGTEGQVVNLGLALDPARFAIHFGCTNRWGRLIEKIEARGIPILDYNIRTFRNPRVLAAQLRLARDIRRRRIRIVHSYGFYANVYAIPAAKLAGARSIASIRDMGVYLSPNQQLAQRLICSFADRILVNASAIRDWLVSQGYDGRRISVIPNGIELDRFEQPPRTGSLRNELALPDNEPLIGVAGRVARLKGIDDFLRAAAIIVRRFPLARFLVIGDSGSFFQQNGQEFEDVRYREEIKRLATDLGIADRVVFTGFRGDVERVLAELTVSVQPSLSEGLSNTLLESMAAGAPVVATRVGGAAEVIRSGENGLLVPPGDPGSIAEAVCRMLEAPALANQLGQAARRSIIENYSMSLVVERTSMVYDSLLAPESRASMRASLETV